MAKFVKIKARDWKLPKRFDGKIAEVVEVTSKGNYKVRIGEAKTIRTIDPKEDVYEELSS